MYFLLKESLFFRGHVRHPTPPAMYKNPTNNGINYQPQSISRISSINSISTCSESVYFPIDVTRSWLPSRWNAPCLRKCPMMVSWDWAWEVPAEQGGTHLRWRLGGGMVTSKSKSLEGLLNCSFQVSFPPWKPTSRIHPYPSISILLLNGAPLGLSAETGSDFFSRLLASHDRMVPQIGLSLGAQSGELYLGHHEVWPVPLGKEKRYLCKGTSNKSSGVLGFAHVGVEVLGSFCQRLRSLWAIRWWWFIDLSWFISC